MRLHSRCHSAVRVTARFQNVALAAPEASAFAVRPNPATGQPQPLVVCHFGICPLQLHRNLEDARLEPPLPLRNHHASKFNLRSVHDAAYDPHSGLVLFAHCTSLYGMDETNRVVQIAGDNEGGLQFDGPAHEARFQGAQRLAPTGTGTTFIRDRDSSSPNGFSLRALLEAPTLCGTRGSGDRAVVTVALETDSGGPAVLAYDTRGGSLLLSRRGRDLHRLLPHGLSQTLLGGDVNPVTSGTLSYSASAAAASTTSGLDTMWGSTTWDSASDSDSSSTATSATISSNTTSPSSQAPNSTSLAASTSSATTSSISPYRPITNIQALAADSLTGDVFLLDGVSGSTTNLLVLRPDGRLESVASGLRVGPQGCTRWPRLAVLPGGTLALYGTSAHDIMLLRV